MVIELQEQDYQAFFGIHSNFDDIVQYHSFENSKIQIINKILRKKRFYQAIITPLSVHNCGGGQTSSTP